MAKRRRPMQITIETIIKNYGLEEALDKAIELRDEFHLKLRSGSWHPLVIEVTPAGELSVTGQGSPLAPGGRTTRDPEIVFNIGNWYAVEITQDPVGVYHRFAEGRYSPSTERLAKIWALNLREQGFTDKSECTANSITHDLETGQLKGACCENVEEVVKNQ